MAADGGVLTIMRTTYASGTTRSAATPEIVVELDGTCTSFSAIVGLDDEVGNNGSVGFEVWGDGTMRASINGADRPMTGQALTANISGVTTLRLVVTNGGDNIYWDHADWAEAKVVCGAQPPSDTTAPEVTSTNPADGATNVAVDAAITVDFSEDLDTGSIPGNVELQVQGAPGLTQISASYSSSTDRLTITPDSDLEADTTYVLTVAGGPGGVADLAGNPLVSDTVISFTTSAPAPSGDEVYISDMTWVSSTNGWGPVERDLANGEQGSGDGAPLTIGGTSFAKGLGAHAVSSVVVSLDGTCSTFAAMVGIDGEVGNRGSVAFQIYGDGTLLYSSPVQNGGDAPHPITVDIDGVTELRLAVTNGGDNIEYDHADWGDARVICTNGGGGGDTTPPAIVNRAPAPDATDIDPQTTVMATFSEALDPSSVSTVTIEEQGGSVIPASLDYSSATLAITLTPAEPLLDGATYVVTVYGGPTGIRDLAGNALPADVSWSFTTAEAVTTPPLFEDPVKISAGTNAHGVSVVDVNEDGNLDLIVATTGDDAVVILLGDGAGGFASSGSYPTGVHPKFATTGDFNGDGDIDFASANQDDTGGMTSASISATAMDHSRWPGTLVPARIHTRLPRAISMRTGTRIWSSSAGEARSRASCWATATEHSRKRPT
ncbi:MAG: NPCBM/NEW2 domain-containing protein [Thermomicrobiales bacterium]